MDEWKSRSGRAMVWDSRSMTMGGYEYGLMSGWRWDIGRDDWVVGGNHADDCVDCAALIPIDAT